MFSKIIMKRSVLIILSVLAVLTISADALRLRPERGEQHPRFMGNLLSYLYSEADSLTHQLNEKYTGEYTYNTESLQNVVVKQLIGAEWLLLENYNYLFEENRVTQEIYQIYDNVWVNYQMQNYEYDDETIMNYKLKYWIDGQWQLYLQINYIYDEQQTLIREDWNYYSFLKRGVNYKVEYSYNPEARVTTELWSYSDDGAAWINYSKGIYQKDDSGLVTNELWQNYVDGNWYDYSQYEYTYTDAGVVEHISGFLMGESAWVNYTDIAYIYVEDFYNTLLIGKLWSIETSTWVNNYQYEYTYEGTVSNDVSEVTKPNLQVTLYPNPLQASVKYASNNQLQKVEVYNLRGQKVFSSRLNNSKGTLDKIDISSLANGIYLFRFEDNEGNVRTMKQVKLK